jgi:phosphonate transport system substrate-binding protein
LKLKHLATLAIAALVLTGCSTEPQEQQMPEVLKFAGTKIDATRDTFEVYDLLLQELEKEIGIPIEYYPTDSNPAIAEAFISGRVDIALMGILGFLGTKKTIDDVQLVGVTKRLNADLPGYFSIGITRKDSGITSIADLAGEKVCLSGTGSTTGDLLPSKALLDAGIEPRFDKDQDLQAVMLGTSVLAFGAVRDGDCIAGFGLDTAFTTYMPAAGEINPDEFDVFWTSERVPGAPLVVRSDLPGGLSDKISAAFINVLNKSSLVERGICTSEEDCDFLASNLWGFVEADPSDYDFIEEACAETGFEICQ